MNRKLKRYLEEEEKTLRKIGELQAHLEELQMLRKQEEDQQIVRSIRSMKLGAWELYRMLETLAQGELNLASLETFVKAGKDTHHQKKQVPSVPDRKESDESAANAPDRKETAKQHEA